MSDLPPGWEWATLGELVDVLDSRRIPVSASERQKRQGNVPYYGATGQVGWINEKLFDEELLLLGEDGVQFLDQLKPKAYVVSGPVWVNNHAHVLRTRPGVERRYLLWYLNVFDYRGFVTGTTRLKLTQAMMAKIPVALAPADEQLRVAKALEGHLSRLDAGTALLTVSARRLRRLADQVISSYCAGSQLSSLDAAAAKPQDVGLQDGDLPHLPEHWRWMRLHEIADVVGGVTKDAKRQADLDLTEVPYLRVANVQRGHLDLSSVTTIRVPPRQVEKLALRPGDVLLNEGGDRDKLARGWVWEGQLPLCIHQNHVFRARIRDGVLEPRILAWHANGFGQRWAEANGKQSVNLASISLSKIRQMPVPVPPRSEQIGIIKAIEEATTAVGRLADSIAAGRTQVERLRRSLLADAFAGRLVPQGPADEPASVLLERIRAARAATPKPKRARRGPKPDPAQETLS